MGKKVDENSYSDQYGFSIALDSLNNQYITGFFGGPTSFGSTTLTPNGWSDLFIAKHKSEPIWLCNTNNKEVLQQNTVLNILWDTNIPRNLKLEYTTNNGTTWQTIATNIPSSQNSYAWTLPNISSSQCKVRISDMSDNQIVDESDNQFTICDKGIVIISANGQALKIGSSQAINWQTINNIPNLKFEYTINSDQPTPTWQTMNGTLVSGMFIWNVPNTPSRNCKIKISNAANLQEYFISDQFVIYDLKVTAPNGGENWGVNQQHDITWTAASLNDLKIEYSANNGQNWSTITASTPSNNGLYNWTIPNSISNNCIVRVSDTNNPSVSDESNNLFKISGNAIADELLPLETKLKGCYPNPFNNTTSINYEIANAGLVNLSIINSKGELVKTLVNCKSNSGRFNIKFDAAGLNSGIYFYKLEADGKSMIQKMMLIK